MARIDASSMFETAVAAPMPLREVGQHTQRNMRRHAFFGAMVNGTNSAGPGPCDNKRHVPPATDKVGSLPVKAN